MYDTFDEYFEKPKPFRQPRHEERGHMREIDGEWYALGSNEPVRIKNEYYQREPQLGEL